MTDTQKDVLSKRIEFLERLNKELELIAHRWRWLAVAGTGLLFVIFILTAVILTIREQDARRDADYLRLKPQDQKERREQERANQLGRTGQEVE